MEEINGLQDFSLIDFANTAGNINNATKEIYYERKNNRIRMYDANHVIKVAGNNIEFLNLLKSLNINQVNSPDKLLKDVSSDKFYIISKYLEEYLELNFCSKYIFSFTEVLDCFIQILQILEKCHRSDFYVGDLHTSNILISPDKKAYLFDFDQSIFIKNKIISGDKNETLSTLYQNPIINNVLKETYGVSEENFSFYNSYIQLLKPFFSEIDKEYIIREIIRLILFKLGICKDEYDITKRDITKLFLSKNLEKKLITCLIERIPLEYDDYLIFDLMDLKESKLIRKKLNW